MTNYVHIVSFSFSLLSALSFVPLFPTYTTIQYEYLFVILHYTSVLISTNNCLVDFYNCSLQTMTVFFTRNFTQAWLNSYYPLRVLSCGSDQFDEGSWSGTFGTLPSREFYCDYIFVYALCTQPFALMLVVVGLLMQQAYCICWCSCWCSFCLSFAIINDSTLFSFS